MNLHTTTPEVHATRFRRLIAAVGVGLVLMLGTATVAPVLHDWLHAHADGHHETHHQCAVVLFGSGVALAAGAIILMGPTLAWRAGSAVADSEIFLVEPRYLRQPERGPPLG